MLNASWKVPCGIYWDVWIISVNIHAHMYCSICNKYTDGSQSDNTELLAWNLCSCKVLFLLLGCLCNILIVLVCKTPVDTSNDISWCIKHSGKHKLLNTVCIGSRCVEYNDSLLGTLVKRNIVYSCTCSCHSKHLVTKLHVMHSGTSYKCCICILNIINLFIIVREQIKAYSCDWV